LLFPHRIPVVVHILFNAAGDDLSDAQVASQIDVLAPSRTTVPCDREPWRNCRTSVEVTVLALLEEPGDPSLSEKRIDDDARAVVRRHSSSGLRTSACPVTRTRDGRRPGGCTGGTRAVQEPTDDRSVPHRWAASPRRRARLMSGRSVCPRSTVASPVVDLRG
jgi:hypothetical protein